LLRLDIKPENILLHADSHIRVIDFGLAKHQADYRMEQKMVVKRSLFSRKVHQPADTRSRLRSHSRTLIATHPLSRRAV